MALTDQLLSAQGKSAKAGTTSITFDKVERRPDGVVEVRLTATEQGPRGNDPGWHEALTERFEAQDDKGRPCPIPSRGASWNGNRPNEAHLRFEVRRPVGANPGPVSKFIFHEWVTREHLASFEFKGLPLP